MPRAHVANAIVDPVVTGSTMVRMAELAGQMIATEQVPGANLITSIGPAATQPVFHLHWHIVPRHHSDGRWLPWTIQEKSDLRLLVLLPAERRLRSALSSSKAMPAAFAVLCFGHGLVASSPMGPCGWLRGGRLGVHRAAASTSEVAVAGRLRCC